MNTSVHILEVFDEVVRELGLRVVEEIRMPARTEQRQAMPQEVLASAIGRHLRSTIAPDGKLWRHQSMALAEHVAGRDVVVTTSTASGKSLIFQSAGIREVEHSPTGRVLIFYPLKALASDQLLAWRRLLAGAGFDPAIVAEITGDVAPAERFERLRTARVAMLTPDVAHAWLMSNLSSPVVRDFLGNLSIVVLDEAHVLESVFGSSVSFLLRRIENAASHLRAGRGGATFRYIAASATVEDPGSHLERLTGRRFQVIDDLDEGSPRHPRRILHLAPIRTGATDMVELQRRLLGRSQTGSFIAFQDSRQGVEKSAASTGVSGVLPYRNGFERHDRQRIERSLKSGEARGVVATSALEMGIDISEFAVGINTGVPTSRKALRQRIGRVGRSSAGIFAVIAPPDEWTRFGETFREFVTGGVEPCSLYLGNHFLQTAHAQCLHREMQAIGQRSPAAPPGFWPNGFPEALEACEPDGHGSPHHRYPLRDVGDTSLKLCAGDEVIGQLTLRNAIVEAYPGATYLHMGKPWEVRGWGKSATGGAEIRLVPGASRRPTRPIISSYVNVDLTEAGLFPGRFLGSAEGFIAECRLEVVERVEGYKRDDRPILYSQVSGDDGGRSSKSRRFETSGIVLSMPRLRPSEELKAAIGAVMTNKLRRAEAIAIHDLGFATENIALEAFGLVANVTDTVVIYDKTYGSLRLSSALFDQFAVYLEDMVRGGKMSETGEAVLPASVLSRLSSWCSGMSMGDWKAARHGLLTQSGLSEVEGFDAMPPGARFSRFGAAWEVVEPAVVLAAGKRRLGYWVKPVASHGGRRLVNEHEVVPAREKVTWSLGSP